MKNQRKICGTCRFNRPVREWISKHHVKVNRCDNQNSENRGSPTFYDHEGCNDWEGKMASERMSDLISRQAAIDAINKAVTKEAARWSVKELPSEPVGNTEQLRPKGRWIIDGHHIECDQCGIYFCNSDREGDALPRNFCPNCGAEMGGAKNE